MLSKRIHAAVVTAVVTFIAATMAQFSLAVDWRVGVAKTDVTPQERFV